MLIWCLLDRASLWQLKNKKPTRRHLFYLLYFLDTQHVSGINMSIFRSCVSAGSPDTTLAEQHPNPNAAIQEQYSQYGSSTT